QRGIIYDRNYRELAMSVQVDSVFAAPGEIPQRENTISLLARVLNMDVGVLRQRMRAAKQFCWIKRKIEPAEAARVRALNLKGVYLQKEAKRFYPKGELAAHLLGYVDLDDNGLGGIELKLDQQIKGRPGLMLVETDARRRNFGARETKSPESGEN